VSRRTKYTAQSYHTTGTVLAPPDLDNIGEEYNYPLINNPRLFLLRWGREKRGGMLTTLRYNARD
jgi:hypothetical protein